MIEERYLADKSWFSTIRRGCFAEAGERTCAPHPTAAATAGSLALMKKKGGEICRREDLFTRAD